MFVSKIVDLVKFKKNQFIRETVNTYVGQIGQYRFYRSVGSPLLYTIGCHIFYIGHHIPPRSIGQKADKALIGGFLKV